MYSDTSAFSLEGGEKIVEEEEGDEDPTTNNNSNNAPFAAAKSSPANSPGKNSGSVVLSDSVTTMAKRRKFEDAKEELLSQAKLKNIGLRVVKLEFAKSTMLKKVDCRRKLMSLGFKSEELTDEKFNILFNGLDAANSGSVYTDEIIRLFEREIEEDQMACEIPEIEDDDVPEKLHQDGILEISVRAAKDLVTRSRHQTSALRQMQRKVHFPAKAYSSSEVARRRRIAKKICAQNSALAAQILPFLRKCGLLSPEDARTMKKQATQGFSRESKVQYQQVPSPVETFYELLEGACAENNGDREAVGAQYELDARSPFPDKLKGLRGSFSSGIVFNDKLDISAQAISDLHKSDRMKALEEKRRNRLANLQKQKQLALGDKQKTTALPRLIGGRKSGSTHVSCVDCGTRILVGARRGQTSGDEAGAIPSYLCAGSNCMNSFCKSCFMLLPEKKKFCEDCFQHESLPLESFGERLRAIVIEKLGSSSEQRVRLDEIFRSFDTDSSGALSPEEFGRALDMLNIQPPLTEEQKSSLLVQFDSNRDGEISQSEFKDWILKDQVWSPSKASHGLQEGNSFGVSSSSGDSKVTSDILTSTIAPVLDDIINSAFEAYTFSSSTDHWLRTRTTSKSNSLRVFHDTTTEAKGDQVTSESGTIVFMRLMNLAMSDSLDGGGSYSPTVAAKVFEHFDSDKSGRMDQGEFTTFVEALGLHLDKNDAKLLMCRMETAADDGSVGFSNFMAYVESIMAKSGQKTSSSSTLPSSPSLVDAIVHMDTQVSMDSAKRESLCNILQQLQWNTRKTDAVACCKQIRDAIGVKLTVKQIQRLGNAVFFRELQPGLSNQAVSASSAAPESNEDSLLELKSSGDVLKCILFSARSTVIAQLKGLDLAAICDSVSSFLEQQSGATSVESVWKIIFGLESTESVDQRDFLDTLLRAGFSAPTDGSGNEASPLLRRLSTKLQVALALDALRSKRGQAQANDNWSGFVTFSLFTILMRFTKIQQIETSFDQALFNFLRLCQGHQHYLVTVSLDKTDLVVRVREPIFKFQMDFVLDEDEYARANLLSHLPVTAHFGHHSSEEAKGVREQRFSVKPNAVVTATCVPEVNEAMLSLLMRLRIAANANTTTNDHQGMIPFLKLVESDRFVSTLRELLVQASLPFFWSVSSKMLEFSIDGDYLDQLKRVSFQHVVAEALSRKSSSSRALVSLLKHTSSSLQVRYEVIGKNAAFLTSWEEFQSVLTGHQDTYAVLELCPQGDLFTTDIDRTGTSGAAKWDFSKKVILKEPESCDLRIDRPVVYTDTVKVSAVPGGHSTKTISFAVDDKSENGHFVVLNVRKAQPIGKNEGPRLYCTAYDPFTSCEYSVEGYPANWAVDFFASSSGRNFEKEWLDLLKEMRLGATLTPKVIVKVFNKQVKTEKLIGECEISIGSAITHEGHIFDDWFALQHPMDSLKTTGFINLSFRFDAQKVSDISLAMIEGDEKSMRRKSSFVPVEISSNALMQEGESKPEQRSSMQDGEKTQMESRLRELQQALSSTESAKRDAVEQVKTLRSQLQQVSMSSGSVTDSEVAKWKRKLDQALREQSAQQEEHERRYSLCVGLIFTTSWLRV